ncbi:MAG: hypothetical protein ACWGON_07065, partial [Gemmatimonadota bacterium]
MTEGTTGARSDGRAGWIDVILPGCSSLLAGRPIGALMLSTWLLLLAAAWSRRGRILELLDAAGWDGRLAVLFLVALLTAVWMAANRARFRSSGSREVRFGQSPAAIAGRRFRRHRQAV